MNALREKIVLAGERNHGQLDRDRIELVDCLVDRASFILDALWAAKESGFPHRRMDEYKPVLK